MIMVCVATIVLNQSINTFGSDRRDIKSLERATHVCRTDDRYKDTPCLQSFVKRENGVYWGICGKKTKTSKGV